MYDISIIEMQNIHVYVYKYVYKYSFNDTSTCASILSMINSTVILKITCA